ncbi:MAG: hypothetical protein WCT25_00015 [Candidatus Paceibacterota bacterium]|jgi:hypothetical protein
MKTIKEINRLQRLQFSLRLKLGKDALPQIRKVLGLTVNDSLRAGIAEQKRHFIRRVKSAKNCVQWAGLAKTDNLGKKQRDQYAAKALRLAKTSDDCLMAAEAAVEGGVVWRKAVDKAETIIGTQLVQATDIKVVSEINIEKLPTWSNMRKLVTEKLRVLAINEFASAHTTEDCLQISRRTWQYSFQVPLSGLNHQILRRAVKLADTEQKCLAVRNFGNDRIILKLTERKLKKILTERLNEAKTFQACFDLWSRAPHNSRIERLVMKKTFKLARSVTDWVSVWGRVWLDKDKRVVIRALAKLAERGRLGWCLRE